MAAPDTVIDPHGTPSIGNIFADNAQAPQKNIGERQLDERNAQIQHAVLEIAQFEELWNDPTLDQALSSESSFNKWLGDRGLRRKFSSLWQKKELVARTTDGQNTRGRHKQQSPQKQRVIASSNQGAIKNLLPYITLLLPALREYKKNPDPAVLRQGITQVIELPTNSLTPPVAAPVKLEAIMAMKSLKELPTPQQINTPEIISQPSVQMSSDQHLQPLTEPTGSTETQEKPIIPSVTTAPLETTISTPNPTSNISPNVVQIESQAPTSDTVTQPAPQSRVTTTAVAPTSLPDGFSSHASVTQAAHERLRIPTPPIDITQPATSEANVISLPTPLALTETTKLRRASKTWTTAALINPILKNFTEERQVVQYAKTHNVPLLLESWKAKKELDRRTASPETTAHVTPFGNKDSAPTPAVSQSTGIADPQQSLSGISSDKKVPQTTSISSNTSSVAFTQNVSAIPPTTSSTVSGVRSAIPTIISANQTSSIKQPNPAPNSQHATSNVDTLMSNPLSDVHLPPLVEKRVETIIASAKQKAAATYHASSDRPANKTDVHRVLSDITAMQQQIAAIDLLAYAETLTDETQKQAVISYVTSLLAQTSTPPDLKQFITSYIDSNPAIQKTVQQHSLLFPQFVAPSRPKPQQSAGQNPLSTRIIGTTKQGQGQVVLHFSPREDTITVDTGQEKSTTIQITTGSNVVSELTLEIKFDPKLIYFFFADKPNFAKKINDHITKIIAPSSAEESKLAAGLGILKMKIILTPLITHDQFVPLILLKYSSVSSRTSGQTLPLVQTHITFLPTSFAKAHDTSESAIKSTEGEVITVKKSNAFTKLKAFAPTYSTTGSSPFSTSYNRYVPTSNSDFGGSISGGESPDTDFTTSEEPTQTSGRRDQMSDQGSDEAVDNTSPDDGYANDSGRPTQGYGRGRNTGNNGYPSFNGAQPGGGNSGGGGGGIPGAGLLGKATNFIPLPVKIGIAIAVAVILFVVVIVAKQNGVGGLDISPVEGAPQPTDNVTLTKDVSKTQINKGDPLSYTIKVQVGAQAEQEIVVTDKIPFKVDGTPTNISNSGTITANPDGTATLSWDLKGTDVAADAVTNLSFDVKPDSSLNNTQIYNIATAEVTDMSGATSSNGGNVPPNADNCDGKLAAYPTAHYALLGKVNISDTDRTVPVNNFGDPNCSFSMDAMDTALNTEDANDGAITAWFHSRSITESSAGGINGTAMYGPNEHLQNSTSVLDHTPGANGAWGLFQMNGKGVDTTDTADDGQEAWPTQVKNAIAEYHACGFAKWLGGACVAH